MLTKEEAIRKLKRLVKDKFHNDQEAAFQFYNKDGDTGYDRTELYRILEDAEIGVMLTRGLIARLVMAEVDTDMDGRITLEEMLDAEHRFGDHEDTTTTGDLEMIGVLAGMDWYVYITVMKGYEEREYVVDLTAGKVTVDKKPVHTIPELMNWFYGKMRVSVTVTPDPLSYGLVSECQFVTIPS
jgi:hypothetical protein